MQIFCGDKYWNLTSIDTGENRYIGVEEAYCYGGSNTSKAVVQYYRDRRVERQSHWPEALYRRLAILIH